MLGQDVFKKLIGAIQYVLSERRKDESWVDSKEYGAYNLTNEWRDVLL